MTGRGWTAGLLLFAVLVVHGLQCTSAVDGAGHTGHGDGIPAVVAMTTTGAHSAPAAGPDLGMSGMSPPAAHPAAAPVAAAGAPGHGPDLPGHLWVACLAVLAAGLAVLLALAAPRLLRIAPPAAARTWLRRHPWPALLRPPDLFSLCVLRT